MKILLFSDFALPNSCANAVRVMNFAKIFSELGHNVDLLGVSYRKGEKLTGVCDGFSYEMIEAPQLFGIKSYKRKIVIKKLLNGYLKAHSEKKTYDVIVLSNVYYDFADVFFDYAKKHKARLVVNSVEWYDKNNIIFAGLKGKINFIKNRIALRYIHKKMGNIIAISELLGDYYKKRNCNVVVIPTLVDMKEYENLSHSVSDKIRIAYAGIPGKKDYVQNAIFALDYLNSEELKKIQLNFYGPTKEDILRDKTLSAYIEKYSENIICHGKIPYEQVKQKIANADFTILLRPNRRYANAGFPTKVGESMACGTPVIANITSDLDKYIIDGETGFVCKNETAESCAIAFKKTISISKEERNRMSCKSKDMAEEHFNNTAFINEMACFLR